MNINALLKRVKKRERKIKVRWGNDLIVKQKQKKIVMVDTNLNQEEKQNALFIFDEMINIVKTILQDLEKPHPYILNRYGRLYKECLRDLNGKTKEEIQLSPLLTLEFNKSLMYAQMIQDLEVLI